MSDNSSMMMVVLIGGVMCCGMSCVGGLGMWYLKDPCMNGILCPAGTGGASDSTTTTPSDSTSTSTSTGTPDAPAASVPIDKAVYIWHKGCAAAASTSNGARYTILSGYAGQTDYPVQLGCRGEPGDQWGTKWRFQKANGETNLYWVRHEKSKKFLTASTENPKFRLQEQSADAKIRWGQLWYIGKGSDGGVTLSLSKNALRKGGQPETWRHLAWNDQFCDGKFGDGERANRTANDPWFNASTSAKETLWGIKVPGDSNKMKNQCPKPS